VVKLLPARDDVSPKKLDCDGQKLLGYASFRGLEGVVEIPLARNNINPSA